MYIRVKKSEKYLFMYVYTRKIYLRKKRSKMDHGRSKMIQLLDLAF